MGAESASDIVQDIVQDDVSPTSEPTEVSNQPEAENGSLELEVGTVCGAYTQREQFWVDQEAAGEISFEYVVNDGSENNTIWLIALKNIFSKQLPNMPKEYIARLVLDRRHRSVAIVRGGFHVVGGITYRPFLPQGFGEIAFCAVSAQEQVKGFGTRLMNHTKEYAKLKDNLGYFLTYADNAAVGYFGKQGFTKQITLDKDKWLGWIKDYDGGTLMECILYRALPYTAFPAMIRAQREALDGRIRTLSKSHIIYPGLQLSQEGRRRQLDIATIPGVKEAGWTREDMSQPTYTLLVGGARQQPSPKALARFMAEVVREVKVQDDAWPFLDPVDPNDVPDYHDIIKDPVAISTIEDRLKSGNYYLTLEIFEADFRRIFDNARIYNSSDTIYFKMANKVQAFLEHYLQSHVIHQR